MSKSLSRIEKKQGEKVGSHSKIPILLMVTVCLAYLTATCQVAIIRSEKQAGMRAGPVLVAARKPPNVISWPPKLQVVVRPSSGFHLFNLLLCVVQEFFFFFGCLLFVCLFVCAVDCIYSVNVSTRCLLPSLIGSFICLLLRFHKIASSFQRLFLLFFFRIPRVLSRRPRRQLFGGNTGSGPAICDPGFKARERGQGHTGAVPSVSG